MIRTWFVPMAMIAIIVSIRRHMRPNDSHEGQCSCRVVSALEACILGARRAPRAWKLLGEKGAVLRLRKRVASRSRSTLSGRHVDPLWYMLRPARTRWSPRLSEGVHWHRTPAAWCSSQSSPRRARMSGHDARRRPPGGGRAAGGPRAGRRAASPPVGNRPPFAFLRPP
jgi:hypothetical protein